MKNSPNRVQSILLSFILLVMILIVIGVRKGLITNGKDTEKAVIHGLFNKITNNNSDYSRPENELNEILQTTVDSINRICPFELNNTTKLIGASFKEKTIKYIFQLNIDTTKYDMQKLAMLSRKNISEGFRDPVEFNILRERKVIFIYSYFTSKMDLLFEFTFGPDKYE